MHIWDTKGLTLAASGLNAPSADELISAEFTYGGGGSCQSATIRPIDTNSQGRDAEWLFSLSGTPVFRGIPDSISDSDGQLAQINLLAPHRPRLGALATSLAGVQAGAYETLSTALERELGDFPAADIGIRADGSEVAGVPTGGATYTLNDRAYDIRYIGPTYPDAVTDAVFESEQGAKYTYQRTCPPYALRRTGQATTGDQPRSLTVSETVNWTRTGVTLENDVSHIYANSIYGDGQQRSYSNHVTAGGAAYMESGRYTTMLPADDATRRTEQFTVTCPLVFHRVVGRTEWGVEDATVDTSAARVDVQIHVKHVPTGKLISYETSFGKHSARGITINATFDFGALGDGGEVEIQYLLRCAGVELNAYLTFFPPTTEFKRSKPNLEAVIMPEGWERPFRTDSRFEFRLLGWHIPPFRVSGLPNHRSQMVASASVTWNKSECSTLIATEAVGYDR